MSIYFEKACLNNAQYQINAIAVTYFIHTQDTLIPLSPEKLFYENQGLFM